MMDVSSAGPLCQAQGTSPGKALLVCPCPGHWDPIQIPILSRPASTLPLGVLATCRLPPALGISLGLFGDGCDSVNVFGRRRSLSGNSWLLRAFFCFEWTKWSLEGRG